MASGLLMSGFSLIGLHGSYGNMAWCPAFKLAMLYYPTDLGLLRAIWCFLCAFKTGGISVVVHTGQKQKLCNDRSPYNSVLILSVGPWREACQQFT